MEDFMKEIDSNTLVLGEFNTPLSKMERSPKQSTGYFQSTELKNVLDQMALTGI